MKVFNVRTLNKVVKCGTYSIHRGTVNTLADYMAIVSAFASHPITEPVFQVHLNYQHPKGLIDVSFLVKPILIGEQPGAAVLFPRLEDIRTGNQDYSYSLFYPLAFEYVITKQKTEVYSFDQQGYDVNPAECQIEYFFDLV